MLPATHRMHIEPVVAFVYKAELHAANPKKWVMCQHDLIFIIDSETDGIVMKCSTRNCLHQPPLLQLLFSYVAALTCCHECIHVAITSFELIIWHMLPLRVCWCTGGLHQAQTCPASLPAMDQMLASLMHMGALNAEGQKHWSQMCAHRACSRSDMQLRDHVAALIASADLCSVTIQKVQWLIVKQ